MAVVSLKITRKIIIFLFLLPTFGKSKIIPVTEEQKKENTKEDLKVASSYTYSKSGDGFDSFDYLPRFRSFHGSHSGSNFPLSSRDFNFPTRYKVGSFGGGEILNKSYFTSVKLYLSLKTFIFHD